MGNTPDSPFKKRDVIQRTIGEHINDCMRSIKEQFPEETKLTLVLRSPTLRDPVIFTNDQPDAVIAAIRQMVPGMPGLKLNS